jgi:hypothetical protein
VEGFHVAHRCRRLAVPSEAVMPSPRPKVSTSICEAQTLGNPLRNQSTGKDLISWTPKPMMRLDIPYCIALFESIRSIAEQYRLRSQNGCARLSQRNNWKSQVLSKANSTVFANWMEMRHPSFPRRRSAAGLNSASWRRLSRSCGFWSLAAHATQGFKDPSGIDRHCAGELRQSSLAAEDEHDLHH